LLVSWCAGDRCGMAGSDEDRDRSRRPGVEDRGWSSTGRVFGGRTIGRSGDAVCGLHRARGDKERVFLSLDSKPRLTACQWFHLKTTWMGFPVLFLKSVATVWWFRPQNHDNGFLIWVSKSSGVWFIGCATKPTGG
jgi:hypothetical protein